MLPDETLKGCVVIVTGGRTGIGRAMAKLFPRLGVRVAIARRKLENLERVAADLMASVPGAEVTEPSNLRAQAL